MVGRKKHPNKNIEAAVRYAEGRGWAYRPSGKSAHAWGFLLCPRYDEDCRCGKFCRNSVWSTPGNPVSHAKAIRKWVDGCVHNGDDNE